MGGLDERAGDKKNELFIYGWIDKLTSEIWVPIQSISPNAREYRHDQIGVRERLKWKDFSTFGVVLSGVRRVLKWYVPSSDSTSLTCNRWTISHFFYLINCSCIQLRTCRWRLSKREVGDEHIQDGRAWSKVSKRKVEDEQWRIQVGVLVVKWVARKCGLSHHVTSWLPKFVAVEVYPLSFLLSSYVILELRLSFL